MGLPEAVINAGKCNTALKVARKVLDDNYRIVVRHDHNELKRTYLS